MRFISEQEALAVLADDHQHSLLREEAAAYFEHNLEPGTSRATVRQLIPLLRDDDVGVRWAIAEALTRAGAGVLPDLLHALAAPDNPVDARFCEGVSHVLHCIGQQGELPPAYDSLVAALRGPAAEIEAMQVAHRLLQQWRPETGAASAEG